LSTQELAKSSQIKATRPVSDSPDKPGICDENQTFPVDLQPGEKAVDMPDEQDIIFHFATFILASVPDSRAALEQMKAVVVADGKAEICKITCFILQSLT